MSVQALSAVLDHSDSTQTTRAVAVALANRADENGYVWWGVATIAEKANCGHRSAQDSLRRLEELGELEVVLNHKGGRGRPRLYLLALPGLSGAVTPDLKSRLIASGMIQKGADIAPFSEQLKGAGSRTERVQPAAPDTSVETSGGSEKNSQGSSSPHPVDLVFAAWVESTGKTNRTQLTPQRRRIIQRALDWGYPVADLIAAVQGWRHSPHHRGENERQTVYNDLGLLLRSADHIERFRDLDTGSSASQPGDPPQPKPTGGQLLVERRRRRAAETGGAAGEAPQRKAA